MTFTPTRLERMPLPRLSGMMVIGGVTMRNDAGAEIHALLVVDGQGTLAVYWDRNERCFAYIELRDMLHAARCPICGRHDTHTHGGEE